MDTKEPFEQIVGRHGAIVLRVCRAALGPVDADDAWSETFLAALRAYPELPASANVEAWLVTIARRKIIDSARARARRPVPTEDLPEPTTVVSEEPEPATEALAALPDKQRGAVRYHHLAGLPYTEVAAILGGTPEAARRAAADGRQALRRRLTEPHEAENDHDEH